MSPRNLIATWTIGIIVWVLICSGGWYVATRNDYAMMASAKACYGAQYASVHCEDTQPSDILQYKAEIDRKAANLAPGGSIGGGGGDRRANRRPPRRSRVMGLRRERLPRLADVHMVRFPAATLQSSALSNCYQGIDLVRLISEMARNRPLVTEKERVNFPQS